MSARTAAGWFVVALLAGGCAAPYYAQFAPLPATAQGERVARPQFSIVVPTGWQQRDAADAAELSVFEQPQGNGQHRLYRRMDVGTMPAIAAVDDDELARLAFAALRERHARDEPAVQETGRMQLGLRDAFFLRARVHGPAAGLLLEVLDYYVPGEPQDLVVAFTLPDGQLEPSREGLGAIAATLQTSLAPPKLVGGTLQQLDGDRLALRIPDSWPRGADADGLLASFARDDCDARCEIRSAAATTGGLDAAVLACTQPDAEHRDLRVLSIERTKRSGRPSVRVRAAHRRDTGTIVTDETFTLAGEHLDCVRFVMPSGDYLRQRIDIDRAVASLRWR